MTANQLLLQSLNSQTNCLFIADENCFDFPFSAINSSNKVQVVSNRIDIAHQAKTAGLPSFFSDMDLTVALSKGSNTLPQTVIYRLSKEKALVHHIANSSAERLNVGSQLIIIGSKQQGIKTFAKTIGRRFGCRAIIEKHKDYYRVTVTKAADLGSPLDDKNYTQLRVIAELNQQPLHSKPGTFGWQKIDEGSQLLAEYLPAVISNINTNRQPPLKLLDLGCGFGYLSLMAAHFLADERPHKITATDNCAAALLACQHNFLTAKVNGKVVAADCGQSLLADGVGDFDVILCNPPFHQGFQTDPQLTHTFLANSQRLLAKTGSALFVVNQFVPLETLAQRYFSRITCLANNGSFNVVVLAAPNQHRKNS